ncbi:MAG: FecR domain-containing protein [Campylobacteraceae bacterium]|nr:FecR domain-containing protein [Campylobacteraceae bacterium]
MIKNEKLENEASYWYSCNKEGLSLSQEKLFLRWINADIEHKKNYDSITKIENICASFDDEYLNNLEQEVLLTAKRSKIFGNLKYYASAAVFILAICVGAFKVNEYYSPSYINTLISETKPIKEVLLPDDSLLSLDAKTKINISFYVSERRVELLQGQVFFNINRDVKRPFIITSGSTQIQVLGTSFEVKKLDKRTIVRVSSGKVKVSYVYNENKAPRILSLLTKGDEITVNSLGKVTALKKVALDNIALWRNNKIFFDNISIKEAVNELSRYITKKIEVDDKIASLAITGKFFLDKPNKFFEAISSIHPLIINEEKNIISINKKK